MHSMRHLVRYGRHALRTSASSCLLRQSPATATPLSLASSVKQRRLATRSLGGSLLAQKEGLAAHSAKESSAIISNATPQNDNWMLEVQWGDGGSDGYPYIWMRDNCQCPECFHETSKGRRVLLQDLDISVSPISVKVNKAGNELEVDWSDGHKGFYSSDWLQNRSFKETKREKRQQDNRFQRSYWGSEINDQLPQGSYSEVLLDDYALLKFIQELEELGLVILHGAPCRKGEIVTLSDRIGYLKRTHYGHTFAVKQKIDANNLAYTSGSLNLHSDLPFLHYKPGVQLLHCIAQTTGEGGENHLVDSFRVAQQLRDLHPEKFEILTTTPVDFNDEGVEEDGLQFHNIHQEPMIVLDKYGLVNTVNLNQMVRDSYFDISADKVRSWYDAMLTFHKLLYDPDNLITYKLKDGDILVFDNNRVLHGRKGYHMTEGTRELEGCYWDWDVVKSCRRILQAKLGVK